ncbi:vomeronasal type-2 receptor 26-like [Engystomops pustulosus]|uniref:vomeronasal type-2 receptor 26-like n=1 Tax=Engystomops pustulosus TaxID=76066 RepID=UPI003AFA45FE
MTLGYHIYDSCSEPRKAIKSVLHMLSGPGETVPNYSCRKNWRLVGFIGDQSSGTTLPITELLTIYKYPVVSTISFFGVRVGDPISYGATDRFLSSRQHFPTFLRTIYNDYKTNVFLAGLIKYFGWNWVGIITSSNESGLQEAHSLFYFLNKHHICVAFILHNSLTSSQTRSPDYQRYLEFVQKYSVQVVILCGTYHDLIFEFYLTKWLQDVTLILSPSWAPNLVLIKKYPRIFNCSLSLEPPSLVTSEFTDFYNDFYPLKYPDDKLLQNLWMTTFHCLSGDRGKDEMYEKIYGTPLHNCTGRERIGGIWSDLSQDMDDPVYNAVELMANALNTINFSFSDWSDNEEVYRYQASVGNYVPEEWKTVVVKLAFLQFGVEMIGTKWTKNLKYVCLVGLKISRNLRLSDINEHGELETKYFIYNNIIVNQTWYKVHVGSFLQYTTKLYNRTINVTSITWKTINNEIPKAQCSERCLPGSERIQGNSIHPCCYRCVPCSEGTISSESDNETCRACPDHEWPNMNKTQCISKLVEFLLFPEDMISVIVLSGSFVLLTSAAVTFAIFARYQDTPIVRANNKNLSFVLLVSIMLSFLCVFLFLGRPVDITCMLRQISTGIFLSVSISSLLAKTIMVYIAFKATRPGSVWRTWTGVRLPNCVLLICSSVQVVLCMSWVTLSPPFQELDTHSYKEKVVVQCNEGSDLWFYSVLGYMGVLAAISFIIAFLARTLPDSFNEAKYITFSMLVFYSVWIAMIPAYLSTRGKYMVAVEIFAILTSNAGLLGCIFLPKCYIILFKPELNTREHLLEHKNTMLHP